MHQILATMERIVKVRWKSNSLIDIPAMVRDAFRASALQTALLNRRLDEFPDGFPLKKDQARSCKICNDTAWGGNSWYDKFGTKCMSCQEAVNDKVIPAELAKKDFYTFYDLNNFFCISAKKARHLIRQGIVKTRIISGKGRKTNLEIFLMSDNEQFFPPKAMLEPKVVHLEPLDEEPYSTHLPWYHYCDVLESLKDFGIVHHLGG